jgi:DNA-binding winged helix-turn-helix (wHTH) protein
MIYVFAGCELDEQLYQLRRSGEVVAVEPQVFKFLAYLITHRDRVVTRNELFDKLWPDQIVGDAALTYCVAKARKAVHDTGTTQRIIKTIHGHGYRFIAQVAVQKESIDRNPFVVRIATEPLQELIPPTLPRESLPESVSSERTHVVWPLLPHSRQSRQLTLVGCLFVCGWIASLWQMSAQSPWKLLPLQTAAYHSHPDVNQTEGKLCRWWALSTQNQTALDALMQGWTYADHATAEAKIQARGLFQRATELDPTYAAAYASLGWLAWRDWLSSSPDPHSLEQASLYVQKAVALDSSCPHALTLLGDIMLTQRRRTQAVTEVERALSFDGNSTKRSFR